MGSLPFPIVDGTPIHPYLRRHIALDEVEIFEERNVIRQEVVKILTDRRECLTLFADRLRVRDYVRENLARYKVPRDVVFVSELPRNATGKVMKHVLAGAANTQIEE